MNWSLLCMCIVLISIAAAAPDGRHKRNFSHIKDFITSLFFEESTQIPQVIKIEPDHVYEFFKVPGYDDIVIKTRPIKAHPKKSIMANSEQSLHIQPFECFLGTKNSKETLKTFQDVNNLFSTELFDEKETNALRTSMTPMILDTIKSFGDDLVRSDQGKTAETLPLKDLTNKADDKKQLENNDISKSTSVYQSAHAQKESEKVSSTLITNHYTERNNFVLSGTPADEAVKYKDRQTSSNGPPVLKLDHSELYSSKEKPTRVIKHLFDLNTDVENSLQSYRDEDDVEKHIHSDNEIPRNDDSPARFNNLTNVSEEIKINYSSNVETSDKQQINKVIEYGKEKDINSKFNEILQGGDQWNINNSFAAESDKNNGTQENKVASSSRTLKEKDSVTGTDSLSRGRGDIPEDSIKY